MLGTRRGSERPTTGQSQGAGRPTLPSAPTDQALRQFHLTFSSAPTDQAPRQLLVVSQRAQTGFPRRRLSPLGFGGSAGLRKSGVAAGSTRSGWHTRREAPAIAGEEPGAVAVKLGLTVKRCREIRRRDKRRTGGV